MRDATKVHNKQVALSDVLQYILAQNSIQLKGLRTMLLTDNSYEHFHVAKPGHPADAVETDIALCRMEECAREAGLSVETPYAEEAHVRVVRFSDAGGRRPPVTVMLTVAELGEWTFMRVTDSASKQGTSIGEEYMEHIVTCIIDEQDGDTASVALADGIRASC